MAVRNLLLIFTGAEQLPCTRYKCYITLYNPIHVIILIIIHVKIHIIVHTSRVNTLIITVELYCLQVRTFCHARSQGEGRTISDVPDPSLCWCTVDGDQQSRSCLREFQEQAKAPGFLFSSTFGHFIYIFTFLPQECHWQQFFVGSQYWQLKHNLDFIVRDSLLCRNHCSCCVLGQSFHIQLMPPPSVRTGKWRWCKQDRGRQQRRQSQPRTVAASSRIKGVTRLKCLLATTAAYLYLCCYNNGCCGTNSLIKNMLDTQDMWSWHDNRRICSILIASASWRKSNCLGA